MKMIISRNILKILTGCICLVLISLIDCADKPRNVRIQWLGQACFSLTGSDGTTIVIDPWQSRLAERINFPPLNTHKDLIADIILVSHEHGDHNAVEEITQNPDGCSILREVTSETVNNIPFKGIPTFHDTVQGEQRGENIIWVFTIDGLKFAHVGDLGHLLSEEQVSQIGAIDILFTCFAGGPTINVEKATKIIKDLNPMVIFPMHYGIEGATLTFEDSLDDFLLHYDYVERVAEDFVELSSITLPSVQTIIVLKD